MSKKHFAARRNNRRYNSLGGLSKVIRNYKDGMVGLRTIARTANCSPETVRNDFKKYLGVEDYSSLINKKASTLKKRQFSSQTAQDLLKEQFSSAPENKAQRISALIFLLKEAEKAEVPLIITINSQRSPRFSLANNQPVKVNIAIPGITHNQREHHLGLHKFDVDSSITKYPFVIYIIHTSNRNVCYIFSTLKIRELQTITLRFDWMEKKSRYDYARNNWAILRGVIINTP
jgi:hypothetical protein